jgi:hypothetical protein
MSVLKRVPNDFRQLRDFLMYERELKNKYYYLARDEFTEEDDGEIIQPSLIPLGYLESVTKDEKFVSCYSSKCTYRYRFEIPDKRGKLLVFESSLKDGTRHLVYTELPPAAGSVPLNYDNYIESMRMNDLDGGGKKTRKRKNRKSKKTRKHKRRRGKR